MKITNIAKINPIVDMSSPILLQCKTGECGFCPNNTGKLLWIPRKSSSDSGASDTFNLQYNFFDKSTESTSEIKYNIATGFNTLSSTTFSYDHRPNKAWAVANNPSSSFPVLSPSLMRGSSFLTLSVTIQNTGGWLFFRQPNPAISNVHDALCFEYNNEKRLITVRSF